MFIFSLKQRYQLINLFLIELQNLKCFKGFQKLSGTITHPMKNSIDSPLRLVKRMKELIYFSAKSRKYT